MQTCLMNDQKIILFKLANRNMENNSVSQVMQEIGGEEAWIEALPSIHELCEIAKRNKGPFVMGDTRM